jgi:hypothetical protein
MEFTVIQDGSIYIHPVFNRSEIDPSPKGLDPSAQELEAQDCYMPGILLGYLLY